MRKNGFTLIELLAVIVILAIIAVIAVPIVLNIINDSKESAVLRSADFYLDGVETAIATSVLKNIQIADGTYFIMKDGNICIGTLSNNTCTGDILKVEMDGEVPNSGTITITNGQVGDITLNLSDKVIVKNEKGELVYQDGPVFEKGKFSSVCKIAEDSTVQGTNAGAKYECEVKEGTSYTFYVLNSTSTEVNLIMNQNINSDGTPAGMTGVTKSKNANKYNLVAWNSSGSNTGGPVDAMQFLYNATKDWTNVNPISYEYKDKEYQGTIEEDVSYTSFVSTKGVATITDLSGDTTTIGSEAEPLRARMPIYAYKDDTEYGEVADMTDTNAYLYDNLLGVSVGVLQGYWTLSSYANYSDSAWDVSNSGLMGDTPNGGVVDYDDSYGVRPVINLKI